MRTILFSLLVCVGMASAQMRHYADSTGSIAAKGYTVSGFTRADQAKTSVKQFWWGPFDVSDCFGDPNVPGVSTQADTLVFRGYLTGIIDYSALDTVLGTWNAYLCNYPYPPQTLDGGTLVWPFNWTDPDSLAYWKVRPAADTVSTAIDGFPVVSAFSIATVASDTVSYTNLFIRLDIDSTTGTPVYSNPIDMRAYWTYDCIKRTK